MHVTNQNTPKTKTVLHAENMQKDVAKCFTNMLLMLALILTPSTPKNCLSVIKMCLVVFLVDKIGKNITVHFC